MNRRSFIKALGVLAATPALGKYLNIFKSAPIREGIEQVVEQAPSRGMDFFNLVIKKVMDEGTKIDEVDRIQTFRHPDRPDIKVEFDMASGGTSVFFDSDQGIKSMGEIISDSETGAKELIEAEEIISPLGRDTQEGIRGGVENLERFIKKKYAKGGLVSLTTNSMTASNKAGVETLFERR